jgi:hypothetical protein
MRGFLARKKVNIVKHKKLKVDGAFNQPELKDGFGIEEIVLD